MRSKFFAGWLLVLAIGAALLVTPTSSVLAGFTPTATDTPIGPTQTNTPVPPTTQPGPTATPGGGLPVPGLGGPVISKSASLALAQVGSPVDFTITVTNQGSGDATNVVVVDPLVAELDFVGAAASQGGAAFDAASHAVTWNAGTLAAGQSATLTIRTRVNTRAQAPVVVTNSAELFTDGVSRGRATTDIQMIPGTLPVTGLAPEMDGLLTWLLAGLALLAPIAGWLLLRRAGKLHG